MHITSTFNGNTKTVLPIINEVDAMTEFDGFLEPFDHMIKLINEREKKTFAEQIVKDSLQNKDPNYC